MFSHEDLIRTLAHKASAVACRAVVALGAVVMAMPAAAQTPTIGFPLPGSGPSSTGQTTTVAQSAPKFLVRVDVNRGLRSYREGDPLSLTVAAEEDAYVYVLYKQADGQVFQIYPNASHTDNRLKARQAVQIPGSDDVFQWVVGGPFGTETIKVLASKEPLQELSDPALRQKFFNPISMAKVKGVQLELGREETNWSEDSVDITTYAAATQDQQPNAQRYGLFVGLGQYEYLARGQEGNAEATVYQPSHRDARTLAGTLEEVGRLSAAKIITNEDATRVKVEEAMTGWLPSVSKPGDTVFIFISGMSMSLERATGVKMAGTVLPMHDFMTVNTVSNLQKLNKEGKLTSSIAKRRLQRAEQLIGSASTKEQAALALAREWGITDDLFARWLQSLAGRQVVVILDTSRASAFGPQQTAAQPTTGASDPLVGGVNRLNGLGQQSLVLMGACGDPLSDVQRNPHGLSLMTELLINSLRNAPAQLTVEQAYAEVAKTMEQRFAEANQVLRNAGKSPMEYRPYLVGAAGGVFLKP